MLMPVALSATQIEGIKAALWVICLFPLLRLTCLGFNDGLGANPIEVITRSTGTWPLVGLLLALTVTPLRKLTGRSWLIRLRRLIGLFAFFYACLHFATYIWLDQFLDPASIANDIVKRPFITVGFSAFVLLIPLAVTSNQAMIKRLGRGWKRLHRLVYVIASLGVVHCWWLVKRDIAAPVVYGCVRLLLLAMRLRGVPSPAVKGPSLPKNQV